MGMCNLRVIKSWNSKMIELHFTRYEDDENLRSTTLKEFQLADAKLWQGENGILDMINYRQMGLDEALYQSAFVRTEMSSLLQPRPTIPSQGRGKGDRDNRSRRRTNADGAYVRSGNDDTREGDRRPKGKGDKSKTGSKDRKGDKGKQSKTRTPNPPRDWPSIWALTIDRQDVCTRYHTSGCTYSGCK